MKLYRNKLLNDQEWTNKTNLVWWKDDIGNIKRAMTQRRLSACKKNYSPAVLRLKSNFIMNILNTLIVIKMRFSKLRRKSCTELIPIHDQTMVQPKNWRTISEISSMKKRIKFELNLLMTTSRVFVSCFFFCKVGCQNM